MQLNALIRASRRLGFRRSRWIAAGLIAAVAVLCVRGVAGGSTRSASPIRGAGHIASKLYGYSGTLPAGWHRARRRLVPHLLNPREILSLGTFAMPVGGGGDCDAEPIAAIERMRPGDALISLQETAATGAMRRRLAQDAPLPSQRKAVADLELRPEPHAPSEHVPPGRELWRSRLSFGADGRWLGALVYVKGTPTPTRLRQIRFVLRRIQFARGNFVRFPGGSR